MSDVDITATQLATIPPSSQAIVTGSNLTGKPDLSTTQNDSPGILDSIWAALPFGPLISKIPSVSTAAKGVAVAAENAGAGVANAAEKAGSSVASAVSSTVTSVTSGLKDGIILVIVLVAGYLLLPLLAARRP